MWILPVFVNSESFPTTTPIASFGVPTVVIMPLFVPLEPFAKYIPIPPSLVMLIVPLFSKVFPLIPAIPIESLPISIIPLFIIFTFGLSLYIPMLGLFLSDESPILIFPVEPKYF